MGALAVMGSSLVAADTEVTLVVVDIEEALAALGLVLVTVDMEETLIVVDIEEALEIMGSTLVVVDMEFTLPTLALEGAMMALFLRTALVKGLVLGQDMVGVGPKVESLEGWLVIVE